MSLDVYLSYGVATEPCACSRCGHSHTYETSAWSYDANITHNLGRMAREAGIYEPLWRPDEVGITHARQLIEPLRAGLVRLKANPEHYKQFNPPNGWGSYDRFVPWIEEYLAACESCPDATVSVSR